MYNVYDKFTISPQTIQVYTFYIWLILYCIYIMSSYISECYL